MTSSSVCRRTGTVSTGAGALTARALPVVVLITWTIVSRTSNPRRTEKTIKIIQCERFIFGAAGWKEDVPTRPISGGLFEILVFVSLMSAISVFVSIIQSDYRNCTTG